MYDRVPYTLRRLPAHLYPVIVEALHPSSGEVLWSTMLTAPPDGQLSAVRIPALARRFGHVVDIRVRFGDGSSMTARAVPDPERESDR